MVHTVTHVPPPPAGFVIQDAATQAVNVTPPPPGFEIVQAVTQQAIAPSDPGFIEGVSQDLSARGQAISAAGEQALAGETTGLESQATILSQAILGVGDVGVRALDAAAQGLEAITPEPIRNAMNQFEADISSFASEQIDALLDTDIGQFGLEAFQEGGELWNDFSEENPRIAQQVENAVVIGSTVIGGAGGRAISKAAAVEELSSAAGQGARAIGRDPVNLIGGPTTSTFDRVGGGRAVTTGGVGGRDVSTGGFVRGEPIRPADPTQNFIDAEFNEVTPNIPPEKVGILRRVAQGIDNRISVQQADRRMDFVQGLLEPKSTVATRAAAGARKTESGFGPFRRGVTPPTADQIRISNTIAEIPGVSNKKTITGNKVEIQKALTEENDRLNESLSSFNLFIPKNNIDAAFSNIERKFSREILLAGESGGAISKRVLDIARKKLGKGPKTAQDILKARRAFDREIKSQRPKIFDATNESVITSSIKIIRNEFNDLVSKSAPRADVKNSLRKQSNMLDALDVIAPKSQAEATSAFGRMISAATEATGLKTKLEKGLGALTLTLGTAAIDPKIAAGLVGTALAGAGLKRAAASTLPKKAISQALKASDRLLTTVTDPDKLRQLGADRLIIASFLSELEQQEE